LRGKLGEHQALAGELEAIDHKMRAITGIAPGQGLEASEYEDVKMGDANFRSLTAAWSAVERAVQSADAAPSLDAMTAIEHDRQLTKKALVAWAELKTKDVAHLNELLRQANLPTVSWTEAKSGSERAGS